MANNKPTIDPSEVVHKDYDVTIEQKPQPLNTNVNIALNSLTLKGNTVSFTLNTSEIASEFQVMCNKIGFSNTQANHNTKFSVDLGKDRKIPGYSEGVVQSQDQQFANLISSAISQKIALKQI